MARTIYSATLSEINSLTETVRELNIGFHQPNEMPFQSGQFVILHVPQADSEKKAKRAYSIASSHHDGQTIKLIIKLVPDGLASEYVKTLNPGDQLEVSGPFGKLLFKTPPTENIFFFCTGAGVSQHHSFLTSHADLLKDKNCHLFFGVWNETEIFFQKELEQIQLPKFNFEYVLDHALNDDWQGKTGYVTDYLNTLDFTNDNATFYLCGNPAMIKSMKAALEAKDFPKDRIFAEAF